MSLYLQISIHLLTVPNFIMHLNIQFVSNYIYRFCNNSARPKTILCQTVLIYKIGQMRCTVDPRHMFPISIIEKLKYAYNTVLRCAGVASLVRETPDSNPTIWPPYAAKLQPATTPFIYLYL